jgi:hypothetical protein
VGTVFDRTRQGSIALIEHIEGVIFENEQAAEDHGPELCKKWIDNQGAQRSSRLDVESVGSSLDNSSPSVNRGRPIFFSAVPRFDDSTERAGDSG